MRKLIYLFSVLLLTTACSMRESDVKRLTTYAENGNEEAMLTLVRHADTTLVPKALKEHYLDVLIDSGNIEALYTRSSRLYPNDLELLKEGAEKGIPFCLYELAQREAVLSLANNKGYDKERYNQMMKQAADSGYIYAKVEVLEEEGKLTILTRPKLVYDEIWNKTAKDFWWPTRYSNALFHYSSDFYTNCWSSIFSARWWQAILGILFMIFVLIFGIALIFLIKGEKLMAAGTTGLLGWLNGFALFYQYGAGSGSGFFRVSDAIFHFTRQPLAYGTLTDITIVFTWIWAFVFIACFVYSCVKLYQKKLYVTLVLYVPFYLFINFLYYFLFASIAMLSYVIAIIAAIIIGALFIKSTGLQGALNDWKEHDEKVLENMDKREKKRQEKEFSRRMRGI